MPIPLMLALIGKILAIAAGILYFERLTTPYRITLLLIAVALFCESYGFYISHYLKQHNAWLFNIYMQVEVWSMLLAALFFIDNKLAKRIFVSLLVLNTVFWVVTIVNSSIFTFANICMIYGCLLLTIAYIFTLISNGIFSRNDVVKQPLFWLSTSTVLYTACVIPSMAMHAYVHKYHSSFKVNLQLINTILDIARYPLTGVSFVILGLQKSSKPLFNANR